MGIYIRVEDESKNSALIYSDQKNHFAHYVLNNANSDFWKYIDPYGDTVFNYLQFPVLLEKIKKIKSVDIIFFDTNTLNEIIRKVENIIIKNHSYVRLVGD